MHTYSFFYPLTGIFPSLILWKRWKKIQEVKCGIRQQFMKTAVRSYQNRLHPDLQEVLKWQHPYRLEIYQVCPLTIPPSLLTCLYARETLRYILKIRGPKRDFADTSFSLPATCYNSCTFIDGNLYSTKNLKSSLHSRTIIKLRANYNRLIQIQTTLSSSFYIWHGFGKKMSIMLPAHSHL